MATAAIETRHSDESKRQHQQGAVGGGGEGLRQYYQQRIQDVQLLVRQKVHDLQRLEAQRNDLNGRGFSLLILMDSIEMCALVVAPLKNLGFCNTFAFSTYWF